MTNKNIFRYDINGLRAVAVISVIIFHYSNPWLPGGFVGVDIFFVISGYLMTSIIFRGFENNNFSLRAFLLARAKRIVPALTAVIALLLFIGFFIFEPLTYQQIGKHAYKSLLFISNFQYAKEVGYFDLDAYYKFLLHTWSLSVEWQFYIVYPIVLLVLKRFVSIDNIKKIIIIGTVVLFITSLLLTQKKPTLAYFMFYTRAWEMLIGGLAFLYPLNVKKKLPVELVGLSLIFLSLFVINSKTAWPGYWALLPVLGAYFCILANNPKTILSNPLLQKIGLWSYSIYLVHWPIIVFYKQLNINFGIITYLVLTSCFSIVLYYTIERRRKYNYILLILFFIVIGCAWKVSIGGLASRVPLEYRLTAQQYHDEYYGGSGFLFDGKINYINMSNKSMSPDVIVTGDSFARQYSHYLKNSELKVVTVFKDGCLSTKNYYTYPDPSTCAIRYQSLVTAIDNYPNIPIVIGQAWGSSYTLYNQKTNEEIQTDKSWELLKKEFDFLFSSNQNRNFYLLGSPPGSADINVYSCLARKKLFFFYYFGDECETTLPENKSITNRVKELADSHNNVFYIDTSKPLCLNGICQISINNEPIYSDSGHLSKKGSEVVGEYIFKDQLKLK